MPKPIFVCVPGACSSPIVFEPLKAALNVYGYVTVPVSLPSVGAAPPTYDFTEDVNAIRSTVTHLAERGDEIIMVMHAFGGITGCEALWNLSKRERQSQSLPGGVIRLVFIMSWLPKQGFQTSPRGDVSTMFPHMLADVQAGVVIVDPKVAAQVYYNDMAPSDAAYWASRLLPQSLGVFWSTTTYPAWRHIPSTYVLCGRDQVITLPYAEMILNASKDSLPNMIDTVEKCEEGGHCVFLSQVPWMARMLRRAAGELI